MIKSKIFSKYKNLVYAMSDAKDGGMSYKFTGDKKAKANRIRFLKKLNLTLNDLILSNQSHTNIVKIVNKKHLGLAEKNDSPFKKADGLVTKDKNVFLAIFTADCVPLFIFDPKKESIGLIHSGWEGSYKQISQNAVKIFRKIKWRNEFENSFRPEIKIPSRFRENPKDILVFIAPAICGKCYDIDIKRARLFKKKFSNWRLFLNFRNGKWYLDLPKLNELILIKNGIKKSNIEQSKLCTFHNSSFISWRRDKKKFPGNMMSIFGMKI